MIFESSVLLCFYGVYFTNKMNKVCDDISNVYENQVKHKKEFPNEPVQCKEAFEIYDNADYLIRLYIDNHRPDIKYKLARLEDNNKYADDLIGLDRLASKREIKFCQDNERRRKEQNQC